MKKIDIKNKSANAKHEKSNLSEDKVTLKLVRNEEQMLRRINTLIKNETLEITKDDARLVIDYVKAELAVFDEYEDKISICEVNFRKAMYILSSGGFEKLGYNSVRECCIENFTDEKHLSTLYRAAEAARLEELLYSPTEIGNIFESVLRPLSPLKDDKKIKRAWNNAMKKKNSKLPYPTGKQVQAEVDKIRKVNTEDKPKSKWEKQSAHKIAATIGKSLILIMSKFDQKNVVSRIDKILDALEEYLDKELEIKRH